MEKRDRSLRIKAMCATEGWAIKRKEIEELILKDCDELINMMTRNPEKITGKNAFRLGMRMQANREFLEGMDLDCKI